eukprot:365874-Chlamydomonas_euryale.AAC.10
MSGPRQCRRAAATNQLSCQSNRAERSSTRHASAMGCAACCSLPTGIACACMLFAPYRHSLRLHLRQCLCMPCTAPAQGLCLQCTGPAPHACTAHARRGHMPRCSNPPDTFQAC